MDINTLKPVRVLNGILENFYILGVFNFHSLFLLGDISMSFKKRK